MNTPNNKFFQRLIAAVIYVFSSLNIAYAEDTEIFFAPSSSSTNATPNIMFIIDNSGSMGNHIGGDEENDTRLEVVQDVLNQVLTNVTNVNAGLMTFNRNLGGPVAFPISDINKEGTPSVFRTVTQGFNDAIENSVGVVSLTSAALEFGAGADLVGVKFENLNIPQGAKILSAKVVFTADRDATGASNTLISAEKVGSAAAITNTPADLGNRLSGGTSASVTWPMSDWSAQSIYTTPDLSAVVEEVTSLSNWCGGNNLMLLFKQQGGAARYAYSQEGVDANNAAFPGIVAPSIKITYSGTFIPSANKCMSNTAVSAIISENDDFEIRKSDGSVKFDSSDLDFNLDGSEEQRGVGLVFQNVNVPQGATVNFAFLSFTADEDSDVSSDVDIKGVKQSNVLLPPDALGLDAASATAGSVNWVIPSWLKGRRYQSVDISSIISEIVTQPGWALNNNLALFIRGNSGKHAAESFSGNAAKLHIGFRGVWQPGVNTLRDDLKNMVLGMVPAGGTPISATYAEAGAYFKGDSVFYGLNRGSDGNAHHRRVSHPLSYSTNGVLNRDINCIDENLDAEVCATENISGSPNYVSPVTDSCQANHIVLLTDGSANSHVNTVNAIYSNWTGGATCESGPDEFIPGNFPYGPINVGPAGDDCSIKMAAFLKTNDISPGIDGTQVVTTHTVGFGPGADPALMKEMAEAGGGGWYSPKDRPQLVADIGNIIDSVAAGNNNSFVTSGVTVNQYNRLTNNDKLYFSMFKPDSDAVWAGNVKKYLLLNGEIVDETKALAVEPLNGEFKSTASSFWSAGTDGNDVELGGVAGQLKEKRNIYSNLANNNLSGDASNAVAKTNSAMTAVLLGGVTVLERNSILDWVSGYDVKDASYDASDPSSLSLTPSRKSMGDPLHSQPAVLQYNDASGSLLTTRIYIGTNEGFLHSFDADNGKEKWGFIPKTLLSSLKQIINQSAGKHIYGLDGSISVYVNDGNGNGAVDPGDSAFLYVGQRRGGKNYYAIDISIPDSPKMMFKVTGGTASFAKLGETWSTPTIKKMNLTGVNSDKLVMIFGGGYDDTQDTKGTASQSDAIGNVIYIVDALNGNLLWESSSAIAGGGSSGAVSTMNGVPSQVTAFDFDGDDLVDHMYATDTKAQVFRFDVDNTAGSIKGGRIASLGNSGIAGNRRFYYAADAALIRDAGDSFVSVSIGSGYRAHPLDTSITDHFFVLKDKGVLTRNFDMDANISDLQNVTSLVDSDGNNISDAVELLNDNSSTKNGWYIDFSATGEKVIERSITFNNAVFFTSYIPSGGPSNACQSNAGGGRLYALNVLNGNPFIDTNFDGQLDENDRFTEVIGNGIAPPPQILFEEPSGTESRVKTRLCVGNDCSFAGVGDSPNLIGIKWRKN